MQQLIPEFDPITTVMTIFPHEESDWSCCIHEARNCFATLITAMLPHCNVVVICNERAQLERYITPHPSLYCIEYLTNDTWTRDIAALSVRTSFGIELVDFNFNGWGEKFDYIRDNALNRTLRATYATLLQHDSLILEGGAIDINSNGVMLSTASALLNSNRQSIDEASLFQKLSERLGVTKLFLLEHGALIGDDTDGHIDTLARFLDDTTIAYVQCSNKDDAHYDTLLSMRQELEDIAAMMHYTLIPLPLPTPIYENSERLPATYANFLHLNGTIILPTYGVKEDAQAKQILEAEGFDVTCVDARTLIRQHGSLHCVTMQFHHELHLVHELANNGAEVSHH